MIEILEPLKTRLRQLPALTGWDVRDNIEPQDRRSLPAVDVRCPGARVADSRTSAAMLTPEWRITLVVRRSAGAAAQLAGAFADVFESLHNWQPGQQGGRGWEPLRLTQVGEPLFGEEGLAGYELIFTTGARYIGQP